MPIGSVTPRAIPATAPDHDPSPDEPQGRLMWGEATTMTAVAMAKRTAR